MSIVEAMSYSIPVVITDRVNIKAEIEFAKAGRISSCDPQSIAAEINYVLENKEDAKQMGARGKSLVKEKYELESVVKQMISVYEIIAKDNLRNCS